jgi:hypothetical protein
MMNTVPGGTGIRWDVGRSYFVRLGAGHSIGRYQADPASEYRRGNRVVVETHRGLELGEVLGASAESSASGRGVAASENGRKSRILRLANPEDLARAADYLALTPQRFGACEEFFLEGAWPIHLVDAETLLDGRTVMHYLGPHGLDTSGVCAWLRDRLSFDVLFEAVGDDVDISGLGGEVQGSCGAGCDSGGCGASRARDDEPASRKGCGSSAGCSSCALTGPGHERARVI